MNERDYIHNIIKTIFTKPRLTRVMCSIHDRELQTKQIVSLMGLGIDEIEDCIQKLFESGLIKYRIKDNQKYYSLNNSKVCDAVIHLKDELYKLTIQTKTE